MSQFSCRFAFFASFSSFKPDTENSTNFYAVSRKRADIDDVEFFKNLNMHCIPKLIIFGTHNPQPFKHNPLINEVLLMQFYLFNIRPELHYRK